MAAAPTAKAISDKRKHMKKDMQIICVKLPEEEDTATSSTKYTLQVPTTSTTLNYHGQHIDVSVEHFDIIRVLGQGNYGTVLEVSIYGHSDIRMAVKKILLETNEERQASTHTDLTTIQSVGSENYPFIISYYGAVIDKRYGELVICMELLDASMEKFYQSMHAVDNLTHDDLHNVLHRLTNNITSALHFLKIRRILHRDVKPQNLLVNKQAVFKLCDFGICAFMRPSQSIFVGAVQGTMAYLSPEAMTGRVDQFGIRVDMWALGISLLEIVNGIHPFSNKNQFEMTMMIDQWLPSFTSNFTISSDIEQIILNLLKHDPQQRPRTYLEILEMPTIRDVQQTPSGDEKAFVTRVIDNIPPPAD